MTNLRSFVSGFLDGFGPGSMLGENSVPGAATQVFATAEVLFESTTQVQGALIGMSPSEGEKVYQRPIQDPVVRVSPSKSNAASVDADRRADQSRLDEEQAKEGKHRMETTRKHAGHF